MKKNIILFLILCLMFILGFRLGRKFEAVKAEVAHSDVKEKKAKPEAGAKGFIISFEDEKDLDKLNKGALQLSLAQEHCTQGASCLKAVFPAGKYPGLSIWKPKPSDWSGFDTLKFDAYNPHNEVVRFGILLKDASGDSYADRYDGYFAFKPGENNFELNITGLKTNNKKRQIDLNKIKELTIFLYEPRKETTLYLDNLRLERENSIDADNFYKFDFGPEYSEVWPGFTKVTNKDKYSQNKGYGWAVTWDLKAEDRQYPDALFRDWVKGSGPFNIDVSNGEYIVYMMLEDPGFWQYYQHYQRREIYAEDRLVVSDTLDSAAFLKDYYFRHLETEDLPGEDIWDTYVKTRFTPKIFRVKVEDGQLNLKFSSKGTNACTLSALIIFPSGYEKEGMRYIQKINEKQKRYFNTHFVISAPSAPPISFSVSQEDKESGYILFQRNYMERVYPNTAPRIDEIGKNLELFGAQGEYEPFTIGIYPLQDLGVCELTAEDLTSEEGKIIPANNIAIRVVQYKLKSTGKKVYEAKGELLRKKSKIDIKKGITRQFWATIRIPEGTSAGNYTGKVHFKPASGKDETIELKLRVLPFKLQEPDIAVGMFYFAPDYLRWYKDTEGAFWGEVEKQLQDLKEHNINSLAIDISPGIKDVSDGASVQLSMGDFNEFIKVYKQYGFTKPLVGYGMIRLIKQAEKFSNNNEGRFGAILKNTYKSIQNSVDEMYGPEIIFCLADEISNIEGKGIEYGLNLAKIAGGIPGVKITALLNNRKDKAIFSYLDISTINRGVGIDMETIKKIKSSGSELWFYNIGQDRFTFGFYLAKTKAKGRMQWNYQLPAVDPYFDLDGRESDFCASYPSPEGPINSVWFEWIREGIDDYKYILTLSELIAMGKNSAKPEIVQKAREAEDALRTILDEVDAELSRNNWNANAYDQKRRQIAQQIVSLKELIEGRNKEIASSADVLTKASPQ